MSNPRAASRTAAMVAAYRARASRAAAPLFVDPWAHALAGDDGEALARQCDASFASMELWIAVRTAWLDALVRRFVAPPFVCKSVVLLGAGFDTRAARLARTGVRFFEVDQPASQAVKLERLASLPDYPLAAATHVACDFEHDDFLERLVASGFEPNQPSVVLWEGVVPYLHEPAVRATLRRLATGCHPATVLAFDSLGQRMAKGDQLPERDRQTRALVESVGEPVRFGINDPLPLLYEEGFRYVHTLNFDAACLALTGTYERARQFRFQYLVLASVTPPADRLWW